MRILVIEAGPAVVDAIARVLHRSGDEVIEVATCADARAADRCDVGVFDVELPDGDGVELAEEILAAGALKFVVFFTGGGDKRGSVVGPVVYKGDDMGELIAAVARARFEAFPTERVGA